jgi:2-hydroxy-6-oxonona-2,4-dienedioate hydrolase
MAYIAANGLTEEETSRTVTVDSVPIHYHDIGQGEPIIFLHSYGVGTTAWITWHKVVADFAKDYRCILYDMPNFAKTGPVVWNDSIHGFQAKVAIKLLNALNIPKAHWVGNSQGGQTALLSAVKYPERVRSFVMGGSHAFLGKPLFENPYPEGQRSRNEVLADPTKENFRRYITLHLYDQAMVTDELVDYLHHWHTWSPEIDAARKSSKPIPADVTPGDVAKVQQPCFIVQGRYDRMTPFENSIAALNHLPDARMLMFNKVAHWAPFEAPEEYTSHVLTFLKQRAPVE